MTCAVKNRATGKRYLASAHAEHDPLAALIAEIKTEARADGLTDEEIEAELAAYNAERRI